ncbi:hypothetical protein [Streptomyces sp. 769]|uniref:hypothetical protein n=1 Tax=Streptomyces sp. 769 TaxID=1262452 RepID=UPI00131D62F2|nr:hypothetical protein [Streptomyces sp. 769]
MTNEREQVIPDYWVMCSQGRETFACHPCAVENQWHGRATAYVSNKALGPWGAVCCNCGTLAG